jgi:hypothetical protein
VVPAGCGGDDEGDRAQETAPSTDTAPAETTETQAPTETETETEADTPAAPRGDAHGGGQERATSPEEQEGGAGDEVPARAQALLTGRGGRITPRRVRVPPFISVRVVLRSADGEPYTLRIAGRSLRAGGALASASAELDGLRAGKAYVGTDGTGARIRIEASAEPGP